MGLRRFSLKQSIRVLVLTNLILGVCQCISNVTVSSKHASYIFVVMKVFITPAKRLAEKYLT